MMLMNKEGEPIGTTHTEGDPMCENEGSDLYIEYGCGQATETTKLTDAIVSEIVDTYDVRTIYRMCDSVLRMYSRGVEFENDVALTMQDFSDIMDDAGRFIKRCDAVYHNLDKDTDECADDSITVDSLQDLARRIRLAHEEEEE